MFFHFKDAPHPTPQDFEALPDLSMTTGGTRSENQRRLSQAQPGSLYKKSIMCSEPAAPGMPPPFWRFENQISRTEILRQASKSKSYLERPESYNVGKQS
jgi:hypothetical protein